jgi:4a-hydroxytetrahydrobiopterin dehydratase
MTKLAQANCEACRTDSPHVTHDEVVEYLKETPGWQVAKEADINKLVKTYFFKDWKESQAFADRVGNLADTEGHHPAITIEWGRVTIRWWTHKIAGLHKNDFIMAAKCETLVNA